AIEPGASVVVLGAGGVGLNAVQGAAIAGAGEVIAIDVSAAKLAAAAALGATRRIDATAGDPVAAVAEATTGGADAVIVTAGSAAAVDQGLAYLRRGGTLVVVGMPPSGELARFDPGALAHDGKRIVGSKLGSARPAEDVPRIAQLYREGRLRLDEINEAVAAMRRGEAIRNVIVP